MSHKVRTKSGITLTEMTVVIAVVALLVSLGLPAGRMLFNSFESQGGSRVVISAALASARAIAAKEQRYAGVRFQKDLDGNQYMVFIVHDPDPEPYGTNLTNGFRAVEGVEPIKLPDTIGVMDLMVRINHNPGDFPARDTRDEQLKVEYLDDMNPANLIDYGYRTINGKNKYIKNKYIVDTSSFSIVFSPSGKMVIHNVRVRNRHGDFQPLNLSDSADDIFNSPENIIDNKVGVFIQDDYAELGLGEESSRNKFVIFDKTMFDKMNAVQKYDYLYDLEKIYINPYTGTMIKR